MKTTIIFLFTIAVFLVGCGSSDEIIHKFTVDSQSDGGFTDQLTGVSFGISDVAEEENKYLLTGTITPPGKEAKAFNKVAVGVGWEFERVNKAKYKLAITDVYKSPGPRYTITVTIIPTY